MKESLNMHGSELTYAGNCFTAGYVIGQMPAVMLATRIRPSILIPSLEILWSILTFCSSSLTNVSQLYAIRFLVGLCESGYFPVMIVGGVTQAFINLLTCEVSDQQLVHKRGAWQARSFILLYCSFGWHVQRLPPSRRI